jgi:outer membrane biosynthesis protein TonB
MTAETAEPTLLFNWRPPRSRKVSIALFICLSALVHAVCFYVFQIIYPAAVVLLPPPARVSLITPDSEQGRSLLQWIEAEDPALASAPQRPPESRRRSLPRTPHIPSYVAEQPQLRHVPLPEVQVRAPEVDPPAPIPPNPRPSPHSLGPEPTGVRFSEEFAGRGDPFIPRPDFSAATRETPQAVRFRVAVAPDGTIRFALPLNSSGDPALDAQARLHLSLVRFHPVEPASDHEAAVWGIATIEWGNDIKRPSEPAGTPSEQ